MTSGDAVQPSELPSDTLPAQPTGVRRLAAGARRMASACMLPLMQRAARGYVGGETLEDALAVVQRLADEGIPTTLGYWNPEGEDSRRVADEYIAGIEQLAARGFDSYASIKPPAIRFDAALAAEVAAAGHARGIRVHCDSHALDIASPSNALMQAMQERVSQAELSTTLPGRWSRSLSDAGWAIERGFKVRVVKGQWPDPADPARDMTTGYLEVIDRLAGRAAHVGVATHNVPLAVEAIARLRKAGTPCELELLFSLPLKQSLSWANSRQIPVRIYVPYGKGYVPYAIKQLWRNPKMAWWIAKDLVTLRSRSAVKSSAAPGPAAPLR